MKSQKADILQGTLDMLILKVVAFGPIHGYAIAQRIKQISKDVLQVQQGSLYPALHRLEAEGWISASWELSDKGKRARYYRLTASGRKHLAEEQSRWRALSRAIGLVLNPTAQEGQ